MRVAVYLAAVPAKTKNQSKRDVLRAFAQGVSTAGDDVIIVDDVHQIETCDVAVMQGWVGMKSAPHLMLRQRVIQQQHMIGKHVLVIDSNLFGFLDTGDRDKFLRYSLNGIFPTTGYYFGRDIDPSQWHYVKSIYGFQEHEWNRSGSVILICLQRDGGWSMDGLSVMDWLSQILPRVAAVSERPVVIRPHPGSLRVVPDIKQRWPSIEISDVADLRIDLSRAWCTVTYNSSPGVASLLWGVPAFVTDPNPARSQAWPEAHTDLDLIEDPPRSDRQQLYHRLAQCHFATKDLATGRPWQFMRARLP